MLYNFFFLGQEITVENLKEFVRRHTDIYIGLDGCLETYDKIAKKFITKTIDDDGTTTAPASLIFLVKGLIENESNKQEQSTAQIYLMIMQRIQAKGIDFVANENRRINQLLLEKITETKRQELRQRINILRAFEFSGDRGNVDGAKKDEL